jgi:hypothetical protein
MSGFCLLLRRSLKLPTADCGLSHFNHLPGDNIMQCDIRDEINSDVNSALTMSARSELPDVTLKSFVETASTDIAL